MIVRNQDGNSVINSLYNVRNNAATNSTQSSFAEKLLDTQRSTMTAEEREGLQPTDTIGIILRQMRKYGESDKEITHNGVKMSFEYNDAKGGKIKIGEDSENARWTTIKIKNGTVKFDLNDPDSIMKCLDMFSPEEKNQILFLLSLEKVSKEVEDKISEELQESIDSMVTELD